MPFNLLLLPLLGGFVFIRLWNRTRWYTVRADKERLIIYAALAGLFFLSLAFYLRTIPPFIPCVSWLPCLPKWWKSHIKIEDLGVSFSAFLLGASSGLVLNLFWDKESQAERILGKQGDPFEQLLDKALRKAKTVMITLNGGKVYVGFVTSSVEPGSEQKNIQILPTISGYREGEKHLVKFTTNYAKAYEKIYKDIASKTTDRNKALFRLEDLNKQSDSDNKKKTESTKADTNTQTKDQLETEVALLQHDINVLTDWIEDFGVVIPISEVMSISIFAAPIHEQYFPPSEDLQNQLTIEGGLPYWI